MHYESIRQLRGLAAAAVAVSHLESFLGGTQGFAFPIGAVGVDLFFVISGFVMTKSTMNAAGGPSGAWHFLSLRLARIGPIYWALTALYVLLYSLNPSWGAKVDLTPGLVFGSMAFLPVHGTNGSITPIVGVGWTLSYEMYFYLVLAGALCWFRAHKELAASIAILVALVLASALLNRESDWVVNAGLVVEFLFGMAVARLSGHAKATSLILVLLVLTMLLQRHAFASTLPIGFSLDRALTWGVFAFCVVLGAATIEDRFGWFGVRPLAFLGDASYSLYLTHSLSMAGISRILRASFPSLSPEWMVVVLIAGIVVVALVVHVGFERPITVRLQAWLRRRQDARARIRYSPAKAP